MGNFERTNAACYHLIFSQVFSFLLFSLCCLKRHQFQCQGGVTRSMHGAVNITSEERERVGSVKSPNMWRNTQFHMNIKFFSLDICIICKYWNIWPSVKSERPVVILSLSLSLSICSQGWDKAASGAWARGRTRPNNRQEETHNGFSMQQH